MRGSTLRPRPNQTDYIPMPTTRPLPLLLLFVFATISSIVAGSPLRVSLVFDDGPVPVQTEKILALLAREHVHVNFSYIGQKVDANPELAKHALAAGHELNNHSYTHPHLLKLDDAGAFAEISKCTEAIRRATGHPPAWFWAPFLEMDSRVDALVRRDGLVVYPYQKFHFISTNDWDEAHTSAVAIYESATTGIADKTVILFHEWRPETYDQLPAILAELRKQGCVFLTFTELQKTP